MSSRKPLKDAFYHRPTLEVAPELLGKLIVRRVRGRELIARIVEVEAYLPNDEASHSFRGRSLRNEAMFMRGGVAYVYLIYGMYYCFNVVTDIADRGAAVLIRAIEPVEGTEVMLKNRGVEKETAIGSGPGKLCVALDIDKGLNGLKLNSDEISIQDDGFKLKKSEIVACKRIGISKNKDVDWRFYIKGNAHVSKK